jgi:hypothetical protein
MRLSLKKGAHAVLSRGARQEIRGSGAERSLCGCLFMFFDAAKRRGSAVSGSPLF